MKKKILFLAATHGDEGFSIPILRKLSNEGYEGKFDWIIGNPRALKKEKRFIDADLNRVAPGDKNNSKYEFRRAYELQQKFDQYEYVIDLHGTEAKTGIFTIVTNPKIENLILASLFPVQNIVIWEPSDWTQPGSLTRYTKCGLEIECGPKNSPVIKTQLYNILKGIQKNGFNLDTQKIQQQTFYRVYGSLLKKELKSIDIKLNEFEEVNVNNERFYPLLVNRYTDIVCYKMEEININF
ncbi:MAG: succinylglutamate desuccinylase/aspartoacylase family protein [bacterium]|nr:succinylglutamate desuccinylase/aspartoacylase family protein [bacterium]